jgi:hypothetical protein
MLKISATSIANNDLETWYAGVSGAVKFRTLGFVNNFPWYDKLPKWTGRNGDGVTCWQLDGRYYTPNWKLGVPHVGLHGRVVRLGLVEANDFVNIGVYEYEYVPPLSTTKKQGPSKEVKRWKGDADGLGTALLTLWYTWKITCVIVIIRNVETAEGVPKCVLEGQEWSSSPFYTVLRLCLCPSSFQPQQLHGCRSIDSKQVQRCDKPRDG